MDVFAVVAVLKVVFAFGLTLAPFDDGDGSDELFE